MTKRHDLFRQLREALADCYPQVSLARLFAGDSGLNLAAIDFSGPALAYWQDILAEAERKGKVETLLALAIAHAPADAELPLLLAEYRTLKPQQIAPPAPGTSERPRPSAQAPRRLPYAWPRSALGLLVVAAVIAAVARGGGRSVLTPTPTGTQAAAALSAVPPDATATRPTSRHTPASASSATPTHARTIVTRQASTPGPVPTVTPEGIRVPRVAVTIVKPVVRTATPAPTLSHTSVPAAGATAEGPNGMVLVYVPGGPFIMGAGDDEPEADDDEKPQHEVYVAGFWIARTEVTLAQYVRCMAAGACRTPAIPDYQFPQWGNQPVAGVDWRDANAYAQWIGGRLPTEAEWEKACRGPAGGIYPWGNAAPSNELLNYAQAVGKKTDVGSYPPGAYGLFDMAGNAEEWTSSLWGMDWQDPFFRYPYDYNDGREYAAAPDQMKRVLRGGGIYASAGRVRCSTRGANDALYSDGTIGFRVVAYPAEGLAR